MKKLITLLAIIIFNQSITNAQEIEVTQEKMIYKEINGQNLAVHVFYAPEIMKKSNNPVLALFHGGGWVYGSPEEFYEACRRYARMGFVTFSFQYRLSINEDESYPHPEISPIESVKDARSAIRWIRENAKDLKIDPDKVVVGGQSAGGQLALSTALMDNINEITDNYIVREGKHISQLYFILIGSVDVVKDGTNIARLSKGSFIAEMSFLTGEKATADIFAQNTVKYISWNQDKLKSLELLNPELLIKIQNILGKDLVTKIKVATINNK